MTTDDERLRALARRLLDIVTDYEPEDGVINSVDFAIGLLRPVVVHEHLRAASGLLPNGSRRTGKSKPRNKRNPTTAAMAAKVAGLSERRIYRAQALQRMSPELAEQVQQGKMSLNRGLESARFRQAIAYIKSEKNQTEIQ
jgi:hypothetical protein